MEQILIQNPWILLIVLVWSLFWKGIALWKAARSGEKWWFGAILVVNSLAILELLYIYVFSKRKGLNIKI